MIEIAAIGRVARFSINRPEKRNALNSSTCRQLLDAFARAEEDDPAIGAILLRGNGTAFCSGMDLHHDSARTAGDFMTEETL